MRGDNTKNIWQHTRGKKRAHWGILTWDDLPKSNGKYNQLITRLNKGPRQAANVSGNDELGQKLEGFSIKEEIWDARE
jgi:hypothetical protein